MELIRPETPDVEGITQCTQGESEAWSENILFVSPVEPAALTLTDPAKKPETAKKPDRMPLARSAT